MATSLVQAFRYNGECHVCGRICRDPRNLTCSHTFCRVCLETLLASHLRTDVLLCPTCRRGTWVPDGNVGGLQSNITAGSRLSFGSQRSDVFQFGRLSRSWTSMSRQSEPKLVLLALLPVEGTVNGMAISPNNHLAVCCCSGGISVYSPRGSRLGIVLESVQVHDLHFMLGTGYVIRDSYNKISRYTDLSEKLQVTFETKNVASGTSGGLTVGRDGLIFMGYERCKKIQVFRPEGGRAIREITCSGFPLRQIFAITSSQAIVVKSNLEVHLIDDVSGVITRSISIMGVEPYPAVCQDNSVIIAWVKRDQGLLSIVKYTRESNRGINILTDFNISTPCLDCYLQVFNTGEIAFCTRDRLYIFHETRENGFRFADAIC